jgi:hypothetical protein
MDGLADGIAAVFRLAAWVVGVTATAVASPPIIAAYTAMHGDRPFWKTFWRRYLKVLEHVVVAI